MKYVSGVYFSDARKTHLDLVMGNTHTSKELLPIMMSLTEVITELSYFTSVVENV